MPARLSRTTLLSTGGLVAVALVVAQQTGAKHTAALPYVGRGAVAAALLFAITGAAAAARLTPEPLRGVWPLLALPAGAILGSLGLTALGFAAVPLRISLWLVLAAGVAAWLRFARGAVPRVDWRAMVPWTAAAVLVFAIALIPAWRWGVTTIFGDNPDSHQVVGSAVLFQHAPAWGSDTSQPVDVVPVSWRFRWPILYALAGASNLAHFDPIRVFPSLSGLMLVIAALGFGALAVCCLRLPLGAGPWVAMAIALNALVLHLVWHPYYNQLWGLALLPWTALFGWLALRERSRTAGIAFLGCALTLGLAYPLALLYPGLLAIALVRVYGLPRPRISWPRGRAGVAATVAAVLLALPVFGAAAKALIGVTWFLSSDSKLVTGDFFTFVPFSAFVGTSAGIAGALAVLAVAAFAVWRLVPRREALALGVVFALCVLLDVRLRISHRGSYMDFKHWSFLGGFVLAFAAAGVAWLVASRRTALVAGGVALAIGWGAIAVHRVRLENGPTLQQVTTDMFALRDWSAALPPDASIRLDIPPSGLQLWAQYFLYRHPVDAPYPILLTTYAHAPWGVAADYVITPRYIPGKGSARWPRPPYTDPVPVRQNFSFLLYRLHMPARFRDTSSRKMVQPGF